MRSSRQARRRRRRHRHRRRKSPGSSRPAGRSPSVTGDGRRGLAPTSPWPWRRHWEEARRPRSGCSLRPCPPLSRRSPTPMERDCAEAMRRRQDLTPPRRTRKDDVAPARAPRSLIVWARKNSRLVYQERGRFAAAPLKAKKGQPPVAKAFTAWRRPSAKLSPERSSRSCARSFPCAGRGPSETPCRRD